MVVSVDSLIPAQSRFCCEELEHIHAQMVGSMQHSAAATHASSTANARALVWICSQRPRAELRLGFLSAGIG